MKQKNKTSMEETVAQGIRAIMCDRIKGEFDRLIIEQVDPWMFFNSKGISVKKFNGKQISISGVAFSGSAPLVFWNDYIQPFVQDIIQKMIEETIAFAKDKEILVVAVLDSTQQNLLSNIETVFKRMQDIYQSLRGKGYPKSVPKYDTSAHLNEINNYLARQIEIYSSLAYERPKSRLKKWYDYNPHWVWLIGLIIGAGIISIIWQAILILTSLFKQG